ncbi:MAG: hypothetical protein V3W18_08175 [candidate division Zixibacteria bacterium]
MIERVDLNRTEPVREVTQPRENSLDKTDKPFVAELKEKISEKKKKKEKKKDEIILHDEKASPDEDNSNENEPKTEEKQEPSPPTDGLKGNQIDLLA